MGIKFSNNASALLASNITNSATSITLDDVSEFPNVSGSGDYAFLTLANAAATKIEVQDVDVAVGANDTAKSDDKTALVATALLEVTNQPTVILADELGVRILQDSSQKDFVRAVSIDTISYNTRGEVSIGGRAVGRGFVRVYLDNKLITTLQISDSGYWTGDLLDVGAGIYTLRVDELDLAGEVVSRAETPFKREKQKDLVC